ncbi:hypothetical protein BXZ70DRAFT_1004471 [Cristinia sonorae]|uniref:Uncharacterized protein n=1 Tax=Cristinia sonorae TaxID=1940300 RepID=A0A8K0XU08_9AGAR|nr:hypothetical protein BXZ70DRAFT_1004471 [Cristinia sonorae]
MPTYHLQTPRGYTASHARSSSHGNSVYHAGYPDYRAADRGQYHYPSSAAGIGYYDSGRRRHHSVGHGSEYYASPSTIAYTQYGHHRHSQQPVYYTQSTSTRSHHSRSPTHHHHRSHTRSVRVHDSGRSHSRSPPVVQVVDSGRHSSSRRHGSVPRYSVVDVGHGYHERSNTLHRRHSDSESTSWLGEQFRRLFGGGNSHHRSRSHSRTRASEFIDARTGKSVDRKGRPIYRV